MDGREVTAGPTKPLDRGISSKSSSIGSIASADLPEQQQAKDIIRVLVDAGLAAMLEVRELILAMRFACGHKWPRLSCGSMACCVWCCRLQQQMSRSYHSLLVWQTCMLACASLPVVCTSYARVKLTGPGHKWKVPHTSQTDSTCLLTSMHCAQHCRLRQHIFWGYIADCIGARHSAT